MDPDLTVEDVKAASLELQTEVASFVPEDWVERIEQRETGVLLRCHEEDTYQWTGRTFVFLVEPQKDDQLLRDIADAFEGAEFSRDAGTPDAVVRTAEGGVVVVSYRDDRATVSIGAGSACFKLREGQNHWDEY